MTVDTKITLSEFDIVGLIKNHLNVLGYKTNKIEVIVRDKNTVPQGAVPGDQVGFIVDVTPLTS